MTLIPWRRPDRLVVYPAKDGFRWRCVARNNRIISDSGESYTRRADAKRAALRNYPTLTVENQ